MCSGCQVSDQSVSARVLEREQGSASNENVREIPVPESTDLTEEPRSEDKGILNDVAQAAGVSLGPISLSFGNDFQNNSDRNVESEDDNSGADGRGESLSKLTNKEWKEKYEIDGCVDLWVEEEFNAGSRLVVMNTVVHLVLFWQPMTTSTCLWPECEKGHCSGGMELIKYSLGSGWKRCAQWRSLWFSNWRRTVRRNRTQA